MIRTTTIALALCASLHAGPKPIHPLEDARIDVSHSRTVHSRTGQPEFKD